MKVQYQVTLLDKSGHCRPVSTLVSREQEEMTDLSITDRIIREKIRNEGIQKICNARLWGKRELVKYGYTTCKIRLYDKAKIEQEKKERYEKIKEEKYQIGQ